MTDSTPDDKNLADEAAASEETVQDTIDEAADDAAAESEATTEEVAAPKKVSTRKARPAPPVEDDEDYDDEDGFDGAEEKTAPVRRRPRSAAPRPRPAVSGASAGTVAATTIVTVVVTIVILALLAGTIVFGLLWNSKRGEVNDMKAAAEEKSHAEKVAADYAAGASTFDFHDLTPWRTALTKGVSPELKTKLEATVGAMNQLLQPLQWVSKGTVMDAVVNSQSGSVYRVSAYVKVEATNVQAASGREVVTVYNVTMDKDKDWQITDVGGSLADPSAQATQPTQGAPAPTESAPAPTPTDGATAPAATPAPGN